jgi:hypothetical protein
MTTAGCILAVAQPRSAFAAVSDNDFEALKKMVQGLAEKVQNLEQTHAQDQKTHDQDQQKIQQLEQQLGQTQQIATNAVQQAEAAVAQVRALPVAGGPPATHNFTMVGDAEVLFGHMTDQHSAFAMADFAPIFLFRTSDKVLFEAGFDFTMQNASGGGTTFGFDLSFATIDYFMNDYLTVVAGNMLLPLGTYSERSAGFLNKIPDNPLPRDLLPGSGIGAQARGAIPLGNQGQILTYSGYCVNGPSSSDGTGAASAIDFSGNTGFLATGFPGTTYSSLGNLNGTPSFGGRAGWFYPWKAHYDVELGVSGQYGKWSPGNIWSALVFDASVHISPYFEIKGEYINTWQDTTDMGRIRPTGWWLQAGYKLAGLDLDFPLVNNVELMGRYDRSNDDQVAATKADRYTAGFVYYFTNTLLFEGDYEWLHTSGPSAGNFPSHEVLFQLSYGF